MAKVSQSSELQRIPLSDLDETKTSSGEITAVVTLLWPFSKSALKLTALISDPDYSKRDHRGELKVSFFGHAAENLKEISIGNLLVLSLEGASWEALPNGDEKDVPWHLTWEKRLRVKVFKNPSTTEPYIDLDKKFTKARVSDVFERIAASQAILEDNEKDNEDIQISTPQKSTALLPGSWSSSFFSNNTTSQATPYRIFAQGRRRLYGTNSDDEDDDIEAERLSKKPRLFEPSQSFRYVADSPPEDMESETLQQSVSDPAENSFFDENSFDASLMSRPDEPRRLFVRRDESWPPESEVFETPFQQRPSGSTSPLYVRPDDTQEESFRTVLSQRASTQTPPAAQTERAETNPSNFVPPTLNPLASGQKLGTPSRVPLAPKLDSASKPVLQNAPEALASSILPDSPSIAPVHAESQPMSSFTLEAEEPQNLTPLSNIEMPPPSSLPRHIPLLDTTLQTDTNPITPILKPALSPLLPLPSPFPSSALEKGASSFFPSQLANDAISSISVNSIPTGEEETNTLISAQTMINVVEQSQESNTSSETKYLTEEVNIIKQESELEQQVTGSDFTLKMKENVEVTEAIVQAPEVISLLDDSDEEYDDEDELQSHNAADSEEDTNAEDEEAEYENDEYGYEDEEEVEEDDVSPQGSDVEEEPIDIRDSDGVEDSDSDAAGSIEIDPTNVEDLGSDDDKYRRRGRLEESESKSPAQSEATDQFLSEKSEDGSEEYATAAKVGDSPILASRSTSHMSILNRATANRSLESYSNYAMRETGTNKSMTPSKTTHFSSTPLHFDENTKLGSPLQSVDMGLKSRSIKAQTPVRSTREETNIFDLAKVQSPPNKSPSGVERVRTPLASPPDDGVQRKRSLPWQSSPERLSVSPSGPLRAIKTPQTVPQLDKRQMPLQSQLRSVDIARTGIKDFKPALDPIPALAQRLAPQTHLGEPREAARLRAYIARTKVPAGITTSLSDFVALKHVRLDQTVDVFAINIRSTEVKRGELPPKFFYTVLRVIDPSYTDGFSIVLSRPYQEALPRTKPGDILLLRNIKIRSRNRHLSGHSTISSAWEVWRPRRSPNGDQQMVVVLDDGPKPEYGEEEVAYVNTLWQWWKGIDVDIRVFLMNQPDAQKL